MPERRLVSVVIPCHDGAATLGRCLAAALASDHGHFEVVVVDDGSRDGSAAIAERFPCKLVRLQGRQGVSRARNAGARASRGALLFFTDADCLLERDALSRADASYGARRDLVLGGTYTPSPLDRDFFSAFQSAAIHHLETRRPRPDYVASHAMAVDAGLFERSGGFVEGSFIGFAAGVEDVELSHRLRRAGAELAVDPGVLVKHVFRFDLRRSLANAVRKARTWTMYSLANRDLLADSGAASRELKANVLLCAAQAALVASAAALGSPRLLAPVLPLLALDLYLSRGLLAAWRRARGRAFAAAAALYWATLYAAAVGVGAGAGALQYLLAMRLLGRHRSSAPRPGHA